MTALTFVGMWVVIIGAYIIMRLMFHHSDVSTRFKNDND